MARTPLIRLRLSFFSLLVAAIVAFSQPIATLAAQAAPALFPIAPAFAPAVNASSDHVELPFELSNNKIYLQMMVNGEGPFPFVLDTGAPMTCLDWDTAESLGIKITPQGKVGGAGEGTVENGYARGVRLACAGLRYRPKTIQIIPLHRTLSKVEGREFRGLLGGDLFPNFVVELDFRKSVVRLHDKATFEYTGDGVRIPLQVRGHIFAKATVSIPGRDPIQGRFIVDTGARVAVTLSTHTVNRNDLMDNDINAVPVTAGWGIGGPMLHGITRADSLAIGDLKFDGPVVSLSQDKRGVFSMRDQDGIIGTEVFKRCRIFFDYSHRCMYVEPDEDAARQPFLVDCSGLFIITETDDFHTFTVHHVSPGSPADEAGVHKGDVIEELNGEPMSNQSLAQVRQLLRSPDKSIELDLRRDGEKIHTTLVTRKLV